jgi:ankyrin repeat protein
MADVTEFFAAIAAGDIPAVRALLDVRPELVAEDSPDGASAALTALYHAHPSLADELAARKGSLSVFEAAAFDDTERLAELILADPSVVESWSADGWQPLHLAAYFGRDEATRTLLDADAPVAEPSRNPLTVHPLHAAAAGRHAEIVWLLIASDAPVEARQQHGWTALHAAIGSGDVESVKALIAAGADPSAANDDGVTARELLPEDAPDSLRVLLDGRAES